MGGRLVAGTAVAVLAAGVMATSAVAPQPAGAAAPPRRVPAMLAHEAALTIGSGVRVGGRLLTDTPALRRDPVVVSGTLATRVPRTIVLQRFAAGAWREVARGTATARWSLTVQAPAPGSYRYRATAPAAGSLGTLLSAEHVVPVVAGSVTVAPAASARVGRLRRVSGVAVPARPGRPVQLWELVTGTRGSTWLPLAQTTEDAAGRFVVQLPAGRVGRHTYRAAVADALGHFVFRSPPAVTATASGPAASSYLADVTPLLTRGPDDAGRVPTSTVTSIVVAGRPRTRSLHTSAHSLAFDVQGFAGVATSLSLLPVQRQVLHRGSRLVEVRVDGRLRLRRFLTDGQVVPLALDVRGARTLSLRSVDGGVAERGPGSDLVLLTPVATTVSRPEVGVDAAASLSELTASSRGGPVRTGQVVGEPSSELLGGSVSLPAARDGGTGAVTYDLAGRFTTLTGVPLLSGRTCSCVSGRVLLYGDGRLLTTLQALTPAPVRRTVDVTGVRALRVQLVADPPRRPWPQAWAVTLADPRLTPR